MTPALLVFASWMLFGGSHILLATDPIRARLVERYGPSGFVTFFSVVAGSTFTVFAITTASLRQSGMPGLALAEEPLVRAAAILAIGIGFALGAGSLAAYGRSPMALFSNRIRPARGVERISRHAFFYGLALVALAHVLLVPTLSAAVFFGCLAFQAVFGAWMQDRKLIARFGQPYRDYLDATSAVPLAAIVRGRQRLALREQPWVAYALGVCVAFGLSRVHGHIFDFHGLWIVATVLGGAAFATSSTAQRARTEAN